MRMKRGDKKGLSGIVTALILIVLVLVAAGIVWAVYNSLIKGSAEDVQFNSKCLGVSLDVTSLSCDSVAKSCSAKVERSIGSNEEFDGADYTFVATDNKQLVGESENNIAVKGLLSATVPATGDGSDFDVTKIKEVQIRVFFNKEDLTKYYCSPAIVYEKP